MTGCAYSIVVGLYRLIRVLTLVIQGWWRAQFMFPGWSQPERRQQVQKWARDMLAALGIQTRSKGEIPNPTGPLLIAANHISWVDILVLLAYVPCRFVAKAELHRWPVLGGMAQAGGTLFVERQSPRDAMRVMHRMAQALNEGDLVAIFPEGTTSDGAQVMGFHANLFQAAISAQAPVQPVALTFVDEKDGASLNHAVAYVGDDSLPRTLWRIVTTTGVVAVVHWAPVQRYEQQTRQQWARAVQTGVSQAHSE
jgi:1-acyl-sn-glycerol-3-phosphate acyltransferase